MSETEFLKNSVSFAQNAPWHTNQGAFVFQAPLPAWERVLEY